MTHAIQTPPFTSKVHIHVNRKIYGPDGRLKYDDSAWLTDRIFAPWVVKVAVALAWTLLLALAAFGLWCGFWLGLFGFLPIIGLVTTEGKNLSLDRVFKTLPADVNWYVFLKGTGTIAAADVMNSHAGWSEITAYSNSTRPAFTPGTISAGAVNNSGSLATFNMSGTYTCAGCGLATNSTKGGTTGLLFGAVDFTTARSGDTPDVITAQINLSQS